MNYCQECMLVFEDDSCPCCGTQSVRSYQEDDPVYLMVFEDLWTESVEEILSDNEISFLKQPNLGAALRTYLGQPFESYCYYVKHSDWQKAKELLEQFRNPNNAVTEGEEQPDERKTP